MLAAVGLGIGVAVCSPALAQPVEPRPLGQPDRSGALEKPEPSAGPKTPPADELAVYEGRVIRRIVLQQPVRAKAPDSKPDSKPEPKPDLTASLQFEPVSEQTAQLVNNQLRGREGSPYRQETITGDITRLNRIGRFSQVENRVQALPDGSVVLIYTLVPRAIVRDVQSVGNKRFTDAEVAAEVSILKDTPVDRYELDRACRRIERLYRDKGYYLAQVEVDGKELDESGVVLFKIREGERLKITEIRFEGNKSFSPRELRSAVKTDEAGLLNKGNVDDEQLDTDVSGVVNFYKDRGYLDIRASRTVRPSPNGREAVVTFLVEEGQLYTLRNVTLYYPEKSVSYKSQEEAQAKLKPGESILATGPGEWAVYPMGVYDSAQILGLMEVKPGDVYSVDKLRKSMERIRDAFGKLGYSDVQISRRELRSPDEPRVDILIMITQKQKSRIGEVIIHGNELTRDEVVRRQIRLYPERPADTTAVTETRDRLNAINLFDRGGPNGHSPPKVTLQDPDPLNPGYRDVLIEVEETNTGGISFGASLSSDSGVIGTLELKQRNFDIRDTPDSASEFFSGRAFRGAGQSFVAQASPGTVTSNYSLSLGEPSLWDTDYSGSAGVFLRSREYDQYNEDRAGTRFNIGRRFGSRWNATVPFRIERVNLRGIDADAPVDYFDARGANVLTGVGLNLDRSSLNDPFRPSKGSRISLGFEQVGALGGDYTFTVLKAEHSVFMKLAEDILGTKTILSLHTRASYIPQDPKNVPIYERFYLGGQQFRGFNYRGVSPLGIRKIDGLRGDDAVGGTWSFFWGAEINQPVFRDIISVVGFLDTGTVTDDVGFNQYRVSAGFGVRLYVPALSQIPLAFDFGFPLVKEEGDRERVFTFSLDLPF